MVRTSFAAIVAAFAFLTLAASSAVAGGWAVTTLDQLPPDFHAGEPYTLGYTIRQHGQTPIRVDETLIRITPVGGTTRSFPGKPEGALGHYAATVTFPQAGTYRWEVTQGPFAPQDLGTVTVLTAGGPAPSTLITSPASSPFAADDPARTILPYAAAAAALMFVWRLATILGRLRRRTAAAR